MCIITLYLFKKKTKQKNLCNWAHTIQTCVVRWSPVQSCGIPGQNTECNNNNKNLLQMYETISLKCVRKTGVDVNNSRL